MSMNWEQFQADLERAVRLWRELGAWDELVEEGGPDGPEGGEAGA